MSYCHNNVAVFNPQFLSVLYFWHGRQLKNLPLIILRSNNGMKSNICQDSTLVSNLANTLANTH